MMSDLSEFPKPSGYCVPNSSVREYHKQSNSRESEDNKTLEALTFDDQFLDSLMWVSSERASEQSNKYFLEDEISEIDIISRSSRSMRHVTSI